MLMWRAKEQFIKNAFRYVSLYVYVAMESVLLFVCMKVLW